MSIAQAVALTGVFPIVAALAIVWATYGGYIVTHDIGKVRRRQERRNYTVAGGLTLVAIALWIAAIWIEALS